MRRSHSDLGLAYAGLDDVEDGGKRQTRLYGDLQAALPGDIALHDLVRRDPVLGGPPRLGTGAGIVHVPGAGLARGAPERHAVGPGEPFMAADLAFVGRGRPVPAVGAARGTSHRRFHVAEPSVLASVADLEVRHALPAFRDDDDVRIIGSHRITLVGSILQYTDYYSYILTFRTLDN